MYSSANDVRKALTPGGSAADTSTAAGLDDTQIEDAIAEADSTVDAHLRSRYTIPQDPDNVAVAVAPVRWWSRNIAAYLATLTFRRNKDLTEDDPVRLRYNQTMALLIAIRDGKANLSLPPVVDGAGTGTDITVINQYEGTMFGLEDFGLSAQPPRSWRYR